MKRRRKIYRRKFVGGIFGNIFTTLAENILGTARKVAPIALDAGKSFESVAGTAVGQKIADKIKGQSAPQIATTSEIKQTISDIAPTKETEQTMMATTNYYYHRVVNK